MLDFIADLTILLSVFLILSVSYNLLIGYAGLFSLAHAVFYGVGAYVSSLLAINYGVNTFLAIGCGVLVSIIFSLGLALPSLRISGDYLVIASLGFQIGLMNVINNLEVTGGPGGLSGIPYYNFFGIEITTTYAYAAIIFIVALITIGIVYKIVRSPYGRVLKSIRDNEVASLSLGKNVVKYKIISFMIASMFAAIAGGLYAPYSAYISPEYFSLNQTIMILSIVIIGGVGTLKGPIIGSFIVILLPELLRFIDLPSSVAGPIQQIFYTLLVLVVLLLKKYHNNDRNDKSREVSVTNSEEQSEKRSAII